MVLKFLTIAQLMEQYSEERHLESFWSLVRVRLVICVFGLGRVYLSSPKLSPAHLLYVSIHLFWNILFADFTITPVYT